ncbi:MAG: DeoR/GlpR family DNA-binding transcription regulator [Ancrocorticia sp.]
MPAKSTSQPSDLDAATPETTSPDIEAEAEAEPEPAERSVAEAAPEHVSPVEALLAESTKRSPRNRRARLRKIVSLVSKEGVTTVEWLADNLDVSSMTVYRDVSELVDQGLLTRSYGEVSAASSSLTESSSKLRLGTNRELKDRIAKAALKYVRRGDAVLLDDSTTSAHLIPGLRNLSPITVATNARFIEELLINEPHMSLIHLGGNYLNWADAFFGPMTVRNIESLGIDVCLMSTTAVRGTHCYHPDPTVAETKRAMIHSAQRRILMVDHSKFVRTALHRFVDITDFTAVITDSLTSTEDIERIRDAGVEVVVVD